MAAIWTYKLDVTNVPDKIANVTGTRTDGEDVRSYFMPLVSFLPVAGKTIAQIREEVATAMYAQYVADAAKAALVAAIATQESLLATATTAKEKP